LSDDESSRSAGPDPEESESLGIPDGSSGGWTTGYSPLQQSFYQRRGRLLGLVCVISIIIAITLEWLQGYGYIPQPGPPGMILAISIIIVMFISCITSLSVVFGVTTRLPEYQEMEEEFRRAKEHFDFEEYEEALKIFNTLLQPDMKHLRALFYTAACYEKLNEWEKVKKYINLYNEMQPKDPTAWEMLARAHKRLFEYEEADKAQAQAQKISG
jgi:tetratricopeptide (TPR) repeat protein